MSVACVVVTYNRKKLLLNTINSLLKQTEKINEIIIIDNASTDGTEELLRRNRYLEINGINYLKMSTNLGGAGGFSFGIKYAYEKGYDWIWVMDDDGVPAENCLHELLKHKSVSEFLAPLVINIQNHNELSFPYNSIYDRRKIEDQFKHSGIIRGFACPFNGILISRKLVKQIGFPLKDMFIWGDESEYFNRAISYGFIPTTIMSAIHFHPKDRLQIYKTLFGRKKVVYPKNQLRKYCYYRNHAYIIRKYKGINSILKWLILYTYFFVITRKFDLKGLMFFYTSVIDGIKGNFSKHKKYLANN